MRNAERLFISESATLRDAIELLEKTKEKALICLGSDQTFAGVINDGDIRRALLKGASLQTPIATHLQRNPTFVTDRVSKEDAMKHLSYKIQLVPVIDQFKKPVGYYSIHETSTTSDVRNRKVVILGLGYVGLTLALTLAEVGFQVVGYDISEDLIEKLKRREASFYEKGLQKLLDQHTGKNFTVVSSLDNVIGDIFIITVGTPLSNGQKKPNLDYLRKAAGSIGKLLVPGNMVLLRSTIPVHCSREVVLPVLEEASGMKIDKGDFYLAFTPERTAEGRALRELRSNPQIVGGYDQASSEYAANFFNTFTHSILRVGSIEAAEFCKLVDNSYRDHKFAFVNQLAPLSERLGLDLCEIVDTVNYGYSRNEIPKPSPGVGGACLSKDPYILSTVFERHDLDSTLIRAARLVNEAGPKQVCKKLEVLLADTGKNIRTAKIFLIGMAFKGEPETSDLRDSTSVWFLNELPNKENVCAYDYRVAPKDIESLGIRAVSLEEGFKNADAVVILNNHRTYQDINIHKMFSLMNQPAVFIDTWHAFAPPEVKKYPGILFGGVGCV